jgi:hypothetical protein
MVAADVDETTTVPVDLPEEVDEESKRDRRLLFGFIALFVIAVVAIWIILSLMVRVPDVVGLPIDEARDVLVDAGFAVGDIREASLEDAQAVRIGQIAAQVPGGNERAFKGTEIDLDIAVTGAGGGDGADLPSDPGWDGSAEGTGTEADEDDEDDRGGSSASIDTRPLIPSVHNDAESAAVRTLKAAGYRVVVKRGPATAGVRKGYVYAQIPAPDTRANRGSSVTIWVSTGVPHADGYQGVPYPGP